MHQPLIDVASQSFTTACLQMYCHYTLQMHCSFQDSSSAVDVLDRNISHALNYGCCHLKQTRGWGEKGESVEGQGRAGEGEGTTDAAGWLRGLTAECWGYNRVPGLQESDGSIERGSDAPGIWRWAPLRGRAVQGGLCSTSSVTLLGL